MRRRLIWQYRKNDWVPISGVFISTDDYEDYGRWLEAKGRLYRIVEEMRDLHPAYCADAETRRGVGRGWPAGQMTRHLRKSDRDWVEIIRRREDAREKGRLMYPETLQRTDLATLFETLEASLAASSSWKRESFFSTINWTKNKVDYHELTDDQIFEYLVIVVFYSGVRADMVSGRIGRIKELLRDYRRVMVFTQSELDSFLADPRTIHHEKKLRACVANAKMLATIVEQYGSFAAYADTFGERRLLQLRDDLRRRFKYLGDRTVYHFMMELGLPVLKPDRVVCRIFDRLGLIDDPGRIDQAIEVGSAFVEATRYPIRYIDIVFVMYGQAANANSGIERGVCLEKRPRCSVCGLAGYCTFVRET